MKKTKQIESIILRMLSDGKCHSTKEFKEEILQVNPDFVNIELWYRSWKWQS
ncbi:hypothetical protein [Hungatella hathewayi]|uniref:hypothetical protein n=1 Tax=Hungatella hathewayi TaxID=154046 RepID=UPI003561C0B6